MVRGIDGPRADPDDVFSILEPEVARVEREHIGRIGGHDHELYSTSERGGADCHYTIEEEEKRIFRERERGQGMFVVVHTTRYMLV